MKNKGIFYNYQYATSFVRSDKALLEERFTLTSFAFSPRSVKDYILAFLLQGFYLLKHWNQYQIIVSQIASYHTFLPSVLSKLGLKKHVILLHGTDCNVIEEIQYGNLRKWPLRWFTERSINMASLLLPVSAQLIHSKSKYLEEGKAKMGLSKSLPKLKTKYKVVYNGFNTSVFRITSSDRKPKSFLTAALSLDKRRNFLLKGIDLFLNLAKNHPDYHFTIVGSSTLYPFMEIPKNVQIIDKVDADELVNIYNRHQFYMQLSMSETFGLSLCESILCGCIPIVSDVGMNGEIVSNIGYILPTKNQEMLEALVQKAIMDSDNDNLEDQMRRADAIKSRYPLAARKQNLYDALEPLFHSNEN